MDNPPTEPAWQVNLNVNPRIALATTDSSHGADGFLTFASSDYEPPAALQAC